MSAVVALSKEKSMSDVHILAIDLAKRSSPVLPPWSVRSSTVSLATSVPRPGTSSR
jgi:hypothetical protein